KDDVAISVVGGNDEIATSFCGRTRNDRSSFDKLRMSGQRVAQNERGKTGTAEHLLRADIPEGLSLHSPPLEKGD
ncbi:MAG TPA: hypothetical protein VF366_07850, partial [Dehalococcoidia bacterium]